MNFARVLSRGNRWPLVSLVLLPSLLPHSARAQASNPPPLQKLPASVPPVAPQIPVEARYRFTPEAIRAKSLGAMQGKVQTNDAWMWPSAAYVLLSPSFKGKPGGTKTQIVNVAHLMGNNNISYYRYPWQAWEETVPATRLSDGLGINLNLPDALLPAALPQLKRMGVTKWRMDIGWGNVDYADPSQLRQAVKESLPTRLALCRQAGLRPLLCLDTNAAAPCPIGEGAVTLLQPLKAGDTSALVKPRPGEVPTAFTSGFSHVTAYWAAQYLATKVTPEGAGYRIQLAKPWPADKSKNAGDSVPYAYLRYRPFSDDGSPEAERSYQGFLLFVKAVTSFLETQHLRKSPTDPGYDLEFLNENSNQQFFDLGLYLPGKPHGDQLGLYRRVVQSLRSSPANDGMTLINGFWNQLPPAPGSREPAGSSGGSSHFYVGETKIKAHRGPIEDAFARGDDKGFLPDVTLDSPELIFNASKFENLAREMTPFPIELWGNTFGRGVRPRTDSQGHYASPIAKEPTGKPARPTYWYKTEWGDAQWGTPDEKQRLIAKFLLRGTVFALGKGLERIYWFAAVDPSLGILSFDTKTLPAQEPRPVTILTRLHTQMNGKKITKPRRMPCVSITEHHGHVQFKGDGGILYPDLPNRDILFTQSFQLSDTDLTACVYVPTLNFKPDLTPETYVIRWRGVRWSPRSHATYRDLRDQNANVMKPSAVGADWVEFTLPVCDWPRFLALSGV